MPSQRPMLRLAVIWGRLAGLSLKRWFRPAGLVHDGMSPRHWPRSCACLFFGGGLLVSPREFSSYSLRDILEVLRESHSSASPCFPLLLFSFSRCGCVVDFPAHTHPVLKVLGFVPAIPARHRCRLVSCLAGPVCFPLAVMSLCPFFGVALLLGCSVLPPPPPLFLLFSSCSPLSRSVFVLVLLRTSAREKNMQEM